jgi:hypothetical protein
LYERLRGGLVDPGDGGQLGWGRGAGEPLRVGRVGLVEHDGAVGSDLRSGVVVDRCGGVEPERGVPVLVVVGVEERGAEHAGVVDRPEPLGERRAVLERLELGLGIGLSSETWGREWLLVTPRSASNSATGLEVMEVPRSAWIACGAP